jgi:copper(I)-binding protein
MRIAIAALLILAGHACLAGDIVVEDAWIQEAPPRASVMAAYLSIGNRSAAAVTLEAASSEDFGAVEVHATRMHHGMAHMEEHHALSIEAGATLVFARGGNHFMLMERKRPLRAGDTVRLRLRFGNGETVEVDAEVRR